VQADQKNWGEEVERLFGTRARLLKVDDGYQIVYVMGRGATPAEAALAAEFDPARAAFLCADVIHSGV
jgi:hypothetical protein